MRNQVSLPPDRDIAALLPVYTPSGDYTRLVRMNGEEELLPLTLRSVMKRIARRSCKDLSLCRAWSGELTHRSLNNPLPLSAVLVLTPFKARIPRVKGDEVMGCFNPAAVERVVERKILPLPQNLTYKETRTRKRGADCFRSQIVLTNGKVLDSFWSYKTLHSSLRDGRLVQCELALELDATLKYFLENRRRLGIKH